jgi:isocitrate lyase
MPEPFPTEQPTHNIMKDLIRITIVVAAFSLIAACANKDAHTCGHTGGKTVVPAQSR